MIIGLSGKATSGKDTVCGFIKDWAESNGRSAERDAFADRLKISAAHALGVMDDEIAFCNSLKTTGRITVTISQANAIDPHGFFARQFTGREYLQWYGTQAHRDVFDHDFWLRGVLPDPGDRYGGRDPFDILVITDVRFDNEAQWIKGCNGEVWQIDRDGAGAGSHASEQPIDPKYVDHFIDNNGSLDTLRDNVMSLVERKVFA